MGRIIFLLLATLFQTSLGLADDLAERREAILKALEAVQANAQGWAERERLQKVIDLSFDYSVLEFPEFATLIGYPKGHDRWTDISLDAIERREQETRRFLKTIESIERNRLENAARLNFDLLLQRYRNAVEEQRFMGEYLPITQLNGIQQKVSRILAMMPGNTVADYRAMLGRLRDVPQQIQDTIELLRLGLRHGVTPPRVTLRELPQQVRNLLTDEPLKSPLLARFGAMPDGIPDKMQERLKNEAAAIYRNELRPAYRKLQAFLAQEYLPKARQTIALSDLPEGDAWYAFNVRVMTTTDLSPEEIHRIGLKEVKRIRAEMHKVIEQTGFKGSFEAFLNHLQTEPEFYFTTAEELLREYRALCKRIDPVLVNFFGRLPRLPYGVEPVPDYIAPSQPTAYYQQGSLEAGRAGTFFVNTYALASRPKWEMEALALHEAVPGHHLQLSLQKELEELPWFRRHGAYTAFMEGWGLYAESLGEEMGFYKDPYAKFGQLSFEMWRAVRLVVDTGIHRFGWTRRRAIDYLRQNTGKSEHEATVEIDRYIVWPAQALSYKIGALKFQQLRALAEQRLGHKFALRPFHDQLLGQGALPLNLLERQIQQWISKQRAN